MQVDNHDQKQWLPPFLSGAAVALTLSAVAITIFFKHFRTALLQVRSAAERPSNVEIHRGEWGQIEALRIPLVNPTSVPPDAPLRMKPPKWVFENWAAAELAMLFSKCDLTAAQSKVLLDQRRWVRLTNGFVISPPLSVVVSLGSNARRT